MLGVQVATHLKGLAKKVKLNESHAKAARAYKVEVASLTFERAELRGQVQRMTEKTVKLKSDLKHTTSARARAEGREDEARKSLRGPERGELKRTEWASGWLAFQQKAANAYLGLDFNFDLPSDEEAEESFSTNPSGEPDTPTEAHSPSSDV